MTLASHDFLIFCWYLYNYLINVPTNSQRKLNETLNFANFFCLFKYIFVEHVSIITLNTYKIFNEKYIYKKTKTCNDSRVFYKGNTKIYQHAVFFWFKNMVRILIYYWFFSHNKNYIIRQLIIFYHYDASITLDGYSRNSIPTPRLSLSVSLYNVRGYFCLSTLALLPNCNIFTIKNKKTSE